MELLAVSDECSMANQNEIKMGSHTAWGQKATRQTGPYLGSIKTVHFSAIQV
jgi:hypothetical protein